MFEGFSGLHSEDVGSRHSRACCVQSVCLHDSRSVWSYLRDCLKGKTGFPRYQSKPKWWKCWWSLRPTEAPRGGLTACSMELHLQEQQTQRRGLQPALRCVCAHVKPIWSVWSCQLKEVLVHMQPDLDDTRTSGNNWTERTAVEPRE